jgi:cystathionine beta-synthase
MFPSKDEDTRILALIGNTPLLEITRLDVGRCRLFAKLEGQELGGAIKDRPALDMSAASGIELLDGNAVAR